jgi:hypothetical protein
MRSPEWQKTVTATSPASASTVVHTELFRSAMLSRADLLTIDATLTGATGGTLDVYLQRKLASDKWRDLVHFAQLAAGAAAKHYSFTINGTTATISDVGGGSDATPGVALAAGAVSNVPPGGDIRVVFVAGASTSAGASQSITISAFSGRH